MFCLTEASVSTDWFHNSVSENEIQREREVSHAHPTWPTLAVVALSRTIYEERAFNRMHELGRYLERAACADKGNLNHCRGAGRYVRGYWVLNMILGRGSGQ